MMTDLDLDSKAILNGLVYLDQHNQLPPNATAALGQRSQKVSDKNLHPIQHHGNNETKNPSLVKGGSSADGGSADSVAHLSNPLAAVPQKSAVGHFSGSGPHAIATLRVETSAVLKELARFRACDDQTMSCFYCREWAQWVYRKQISPQAASGAISSGSGGNSGNSGSGSGSGGRKKKKSQGGGGGSSGNSGSNSHDDSSERERIGRRRAVRMEYGTIGELCESLRLMISSEKAALLSDDATSSPIQVSRPASPNQSTSSGISNSADQDKGGKGGRDKGNVSSKDVKGDSSDWQGVENNNNNNNSGGINNAVTKSGNSSSMSALIDTIVDRATLWYEGYQFPLADVYEDLTFDFPPDAFPYDDHQDPLDPALLLPALQVTKTYISLPASKFPLLGNITSELIATHTYPTCQHTKADHPTPSELETQRLIFNSQLQKWRVEYKRNFEREMEPVWQITQLLLRSAQRIEAMRVRLFAKGCRANREQFLQSIRNRTQPFNEYWSRVSEAYRSGKAAVISDTDTDCDSSSSTKIEDGSGGSKQQRGKKGGKQKTKSPEQLASEVDGLVHKHLENLLEVSASWSRTFLESYYGVAREFARELETILGECITMCDRRAQGLKYPPPLTLQPELEKARTAISCLRPHLESRIENIQEVVRNRNAEIFRGTEELRAYWADESGSTVQSKLAKASNKEFRKKIRRLEYQQQSGVIGWAMRELENLLTASDVAEVVADCLELLMTEAEILERAVGQVFVRKLENTTDDLREQRQDIIDDFTEGLLTGREELAGIIGKLMLKEAWRILEANISLQRQKALLDGGIGGGGGSGKGKKNKSNHNNDGSGKHGGGQPRQDGHTHYTIPTAVTVAAAAAATVSNSAAAGQADGSLLIDDDDDDFDGSDITTTTASAKKRKKNKKKNKKKKSKGKQQAAAAAATASAATDNDGNNNADDSNETNLTPTNAKIGADPNNGDDEDEGDTDDQVDLPRDPQNPFASLSNTGVNGEIDSNAGDTRGDNEISFESAASAAMAAASSMRPAQIPAVMVGEDASTKAKNNTASEADKSVAQKLLMQQQQQQQQQQGRVSPGVDSVNGTSVQAQMRSRRGTNAARYVPGVGFVSDDGVTATSPRPAAGISSTFKGGVAGGMSPGGSILVPKTGTTPSGRLSPMNAVAACSIVGVSGSPRPHSRSNSPMIPSGSVSTMGGVGPNDHHQGISGKKPPMSKEALMALQMRLSTTATDEDAEKVLAELRREDLVVLAVAMLTDKRGLMNIASKWHNSVNTVLQTYDSIASQLEGFKKLCDAHDDETAKLSSLLAQAAQEAQRWHDKYNYINAELSALHAANEDRETDAAYSSKKAISEATESANSNFAKERKNSGPVWVDGETKGANKAVKSSDVAEQLELNDFDGKANNNSHQHNSDMSSITGNGDGLFMPAGMGADMHRQFDVPQGGQQHQQQHQSKQQQQQQHHHQQQSSGGVPGWIGGFGHIPMEYSNNNNHNNGSSSAVAAVAAANANSVLFGGGNGGAGGQYGLNQYLGLMPPNEMQGVFMNNAMAGFGAAGGRQQMQQNSMAPGSMMMFANAQMGTAGQHPNIASIAGSSASLQHSNNMQFSAGIGGGIVGVPGNSAGAPISASSAVSGASAAAAAPTSYSTSASLLSALNSGIQPF